MRKYFSLIKFAHTVFALPFALIGFFLGARHPAYHFDWTILLLVIGCMVFARSSAMAFNRYIDRDIDAKNARTSAREIPSGQLSSSSALIFVLINAALFMLCAFLINGLCFVLSPVALFVILGYSYTKRFTWLSHFILGLGLGLAPVGAFIAVTAEFELIPILLGIVVLLWVSGFDIIYAMQDAGFDQGEKLFSVPVVFGPRTALVISSFLHFLCSGLLILLGFLMSGKYMELNFLLWSGLILFILLLVYQHLIVSPRDLSRVNLAFFTTNGIASLILSFLLIADFYI